MENKQNRFDIRNYAAERKFRCIIVILSYHFYFEKVELRILQVINLLLKM